MATTTDATSLPQGDTLVGTPPRPWSLPRWTRPRLPRGDHRSTVAGIDARAAAAAASLLVIVVFSGLIVLAAADRPSILSAPSHAQFFPRWMAGPLGGLWPDLTRNVTAQRLMVTFAMVAMYIGYLLAIAYVPRLRARWVIVSILAVQIIFFLAPPMMLTDIFNYINYGRMEIVHHLNPYTTVPVLEPHSDPAFSLSNWHQLPSPYGPLFTIITFAVVPLGVAGSFWAMKALLMVASLTTIMLVWKCAHLLGRNPVRAIAFLGLNPIVLIWGLGGDHNDFVMIVFIMLGFYLLLRASRSRGHVDDDGVAGDELSDQHLAPVRRWLSRDVLRGARVDVVAWAKGAWGELHGWSVTAYPWEIAAGGAFVTAAAIKASAAIILPAVVAGLIRSPRRLAGVILGMIIALIVWGTASFIAFGAHLPSLGTQGTLVTDVSLPNLLGLALGQGGETNVLRALLSLALVLVVLAFAVQAWRTHDSLTAAGWASIALVATLSWVLPWYILWALPLAALSRSRRLRAATLVFGVYLIIGWAPASGDLFRVLHFTPNATNLGREHQRTITGFLN